MKLRAENTPDDVYVCVCVSVCVCVHPMHMCVYVCMHMCVYVCGAHVYIYVCVHVCVCVLCMCLCLCVCACVCMCVCALNPAYMKKRRVTYQTSECPRTGVDGDKKQHHPRSPGSNVSPKIGKKTITQDSKL